jgi:hypothetical protein
MPLSPRYAAAMEHHDARQFLRVDAEIAAVAVGAGGTARGFTRDLSPKGAYLQVDLPFPEGSTCEVTLLLEGDTEAAEGAVQVRARGYVSRSDQAGMAIEFESILGLESWDHLRGIVLLNAAEPLVARAQFDAHAGLRARAR